MSKTTTTVNAAAYRIPALTGSNWPTWCVQMKDILTNLGVDKHIMPTTYDSAGKATGGGSLDLTALKSRDTDFQAQDPIVLTDIRLRVAEKVMSHVRGSQTALHAWEKLRVMYEPQTHMS